MQSLGTTLKEMGMERTADPQARLRRLLHLRSTADLLKIRGDLLVKAGKAAVVTEAERTFPAAFGPHRDYSGDIAKIDAEIILAEERDTIQAGRPEGCWCLGLGGDDERLTSGGESVYQKICPCPEGQAEQERKGRIRRKEQEQEETRRIDVAWSHAGIPARFVDMRLSTSPLVQSNPALITRLTAPVSPAEGRIDNEDEWDMWNKARAAWEGSWFFYGAFGVGKTGLAIGLARAFTEDDLGGQSNKPISTLQFVTVPRMLSELRSTYNRNRDADTPTEAETMERYIKADLLILDDLGAEQVKNSGWVEDRLYQIIGERHDELRPIIFTSNMTIKQLAERIGERITWRIVEMVGDHIIHVAGPNLRAA